MSERERRRKLVVSSYYASLHYQSHESTLRRSPYSDYLLLPQPSPSPINSEHNDEQILNLIASVQVDFDFVLLFFLDRFWVPFDIQKLLNFNLISVNKFWFHFVPVSFCFNCSDSVSITDYNRCMNLINVSCL